MDLLVAHLVNQPHILRVISRRLTFAEDDVMALDAFTIVQVLAAPYTAISLLPGQPVVLRVQVSFRCPLPAPLPVPAKTRVVR